MSRFEIVKKFSMTMKSSVYF